MPLRSCPGAGIYVGSGAVRIAAVPRDRGIARPLPRFARATATGR
jgi:hypothetical protein